MCVLVLGIGVIWCVNERFSIFICIKFNSNWNMRTETEVWVIMCNLFSYFGIFLGIFAISN